MKSSQNIPKSIIFFVLLLALFFVLLVVMFIPTFTKIPVYQSNHKTAVSQVEQYESVLADQAEIEAKIEQLTKEYDEKQSELYIDSKSSVEDLQSIFTKLKINISSLTRNEGIADPQGRKSTGGIPLYTTVLNFSYNGNIETTKKLIHYLEQESKGCYFINSLNMSPIEDSKNYVVSFSATLYYFDSTQQVSSTQPATQSAQ